MNKTLPILLSAVSLMVSGCIWGPKTLQQTRTDYNQAVQATAREEMLLNLVRMKYRDSIEFIKIPSITGQHTYQGGFGASFPFSAARGSGSTSLGVTSKPTIVYQPEQAQEFNRRLLSPVGLQTIDLLTSKGWAINRVLILAVRTINDLDNATSAGGPTPDRKPDFEQFHCVADHLRELQRHRNVELGYEKDPGTPEAIGDPIDSEQVKGEALVVAAQNGYKFVRDKNGRMQLWSIPKSANTLVLRIAPIAKNGPEMASVAELLELKFGAEIYPVVTDNLGQLKQPSAWRSGLPEVPNQRSDLTVSTRSLKEMMFYLSHGITVPQSHVDRGLITRTFTTTGEEFDWRIMTDDLLKVKTSKLPPSSAAVSVFYRGNWFYVQDNDLNSKATFNLLIELFNLEIRAGGGDQIPLLTI
jgi:hypothetical protein